MEALRAYGYENWTAEIDERASAIDVRRRTSSYGPKVIVVPVNRKPVTGRKLIKLIAHEIGCHVHDYECSEKLLGNDLVQSLDDLVSEGHAMYVENRIELALFGSCPKYPLPWYTLALDYQRQGMSVSEIAQAIYEKRLAVLGGAGHEEKALRLTWTTLYRTLFRGRTQASSRYYYPKDKSYLEGYLLAESLCNAGKEYLLAFSALDQNELVNAADSLTSTSASGLTLIDEHKNILCDLSTRIFDEQL